MAEFDQFISYVAARKDETLATVGGRSEFTVVVMEDALVYTPLRTQKPRRQAFKVIRDVFNRYRQSESLRPVDYVDLTIHASYLLALIRGYDDFSERMAEAVILDDDAKAIEGIIQERHYLSRQRNRQLAEQRKQKDRYTCKVCGLGPITGKPIVECHHIVPIASVGPRITGIDELVTLCPTCHRVAHLRVPPFSLTEIRDLLEFKGQFT